MSISTSQEKIATINCGSVEMMTTEVSEGLGKLDAVGAQVAKKFATLNSFKNVPEAVAFPLSIRQ